MILKITFTDIANKYTSRCTVLSNRVTYMYANRTEKINLAQKNGTPSKGKYDNLDESIFESCCARCQITNKVNKEREKRKHRSQEKKLLKQIDVFGSLLEGKRHQSLARQD